jgi:hypothetical protein
MPDNESWPNQSVCHKLDTSSCIPVKTIFGRQVGCANYFCEVASVIYHISAKNLVDHKPAVD